MIRDDKVGIVWGRLAPMDEFGSFDGKTFKLDEARYGEECDASSRAGANIEHIMAYGVWGGHPAGRKSQFQPFVLNLKTNRWTLRKRNTYFMPITKKLAARNRASNKSLIYSPFDGCELRGIESKWSPWVVNDEGISSFYEPAADEFTRPLLQECIQELKGYDLILNINEPENKAYPAFFERVVLPIVEEERIPFNRLTYGATTKPGPKDCIQDQVRAIVRQKYGRARERTIIRPDHGFPFKDSLSEEELEPYCTDLYSDDGTYLPPGPSASTCDIRPDKGARPSPAAWRSSVLRILKVHPLTAAGRGPLVYFEHLPAGYSTGDLTCWMAPLKAISRVYFETLGRWPANYGKSVPKIVTKIAKTAKITKTAKTAKSLSIWGK